MAISRKQHLECPIERTIHCIGARYKAMIVYRLLQDTLSYRQLRELVVDVNDRMLTLQLKQLASDGLIIREGDPRLRRTAVRYMLTPAGRALGPVFEAMFEWGTRYGRPTTTFL